MKIEAKKRLMAAGPDSAGALLQKFEAVLGPYTKKAKNNWGDEIVEFKPKLGKDVEVEVTITLSEPDDEADEPYLSVSVNVTVDSGVELQSNFLSIDTDSSSKKMRATKDVVAEIKREAKYGLKDLKDCMNVAEAYMESAKKLLPIMEGLVKL